MTAPDRRGAAKEFSDFLSRLSAALRGRSTGIGAILLRGTVWSLVINVGGAAVALFTQLLLARQLGQSDYGLYVVLLGWMNVAVVATKLQFDTVGARYVAAYLATGQNGLVHGVVRRSEQIVALVSCGTAVIAVIVFVLARHALDRGVWISGILVSALLPVTAMLAVSTALLQGFKNVARAQLPNSILRPVLLCGVLLVASAVGVHLTTAAAMALNLGTALVAFVLTEQVVRRAVRDAAPGVAPEYRTHEWWKAARGLTIVSLSQLVLLPQTALLVVGAYSGVDEAAVFGVATQFAALITFGVTSVSFLGAPMVAEHYARDDMRALQRVVSLCGRLNLLVSVPVVLALVFGGTMSLRLFGPNFTAGYSTLLILAVGQLVSASVGVQGGFLLTMTGRERAASYIIGASSLANLVLFAVLTPLYGAAGTAMATTLAIIGRGVALFVYIRKELKINVLPW